MVTELFILYATMIGFVGAGAAIFASYLGLSGYSELSKKLYSKRNLVIYLAIGGLIAGILQGSTDSFAPIQALAVGAGWPAVLAGVVSSRTVADKARQQADGELNEFKDALEATEN